MNLEARVALLLILRYRTDVQQYTVGEYVTLVEVI